MDLPLRRKDVWIVGSVCLISSSLLWRVLRSGMTQGGYRQAPAPENTQVVLPLSTKTDLFYSCLNVFSQGAVFAKEDGLHANTCTAFWEPQSSYSWGMLKLATCFCLWELKITSAFLHSPTYIAIRKSNGIKAKLPFPC